jgi:hypothetical protein
MYDASDCSWRVAFPILRRLIGLTFPAVYRYGPVGTFSA